ncbi:alpha/beta hydrolase [Tsuneonella rigui]|uniref:alpha/beta hydrolase n=1 Tax=Tsuneonella rigui TaxID=1708790 RepID=UPI0019CF4E59|nr:alpha/beta hydrolase [Tsuneonella rigui]
MDAPSYHAMPDGRRIAYRYLPGSRPTLVFLPGYRSDMSGIKAGAFYRWAEEQGGACLLLDYSGCGQSDGEFANGTLSRWRDEVLAVVDAVTDGPILPIGSSMGGWLMLLVAERLGSRLHGLMGIAAAPDFTDWGRSDDDKARLAAGEVVHDVSPYGSVPFYPGFWNDGQAQRRLTGEIAIDCPVRLVHGMRDNAVPWDVSLRLQQALRSTEVHLTLVKDGDHNLSRDEDIALLLGTLASF